MFVLGFTSIYNKKREGRCLVNSNNSLLISFVISLILLASQGLLLTNAAILQENEDASQQDQQTGTNDESWINGEQITSFQPGGRKRLDLDVISDENEVEIDSVDEGALSQSLNDVGGEQEQERKWKEFTDEVVIECEGGVNEAYQIAEEHNLIYISQIFDKHHLLKVPPPNTHSSSSSHRRRRRAADGSDPDLHSSLHSNSKVLWFEQQYVLSRQKRDNEEEEKQELQPTISVVAEARQSHHQVEPVVEKRGFLNNTLVGKIVKPPESMKVMPVLTPLTHAQMGKAFVVPNDPSWKSQWYLHRSLTQNTGASGGGRKEDMNVIEAWLLGYTGKGVVVTIIDDGVEGKHKDLAKNFDPEASYDINDNDHDATPRYDSTNINKHGTRCAGEVAGERNNNQCVVGVAYNSKVGGIRMLDGQITDSVEARSLSLKPQHVDVYSSSWGPDDDGKTVDGPKALALKAFSDGVSKGRGGKGSIFVWAAGNGGRHQDDCNCDGYTTSIFTLSIASTTEREQFPWYSERCSSTLASTYSSGSTGERSIVTTDLRNKCTDKHTGTSASAPLAAGICALALEANSNLTWRDMQHIVLRTARPLSAMRPKEPDQWRRNGVGRLVSHSYGYGLMDAGAMVRMAKYWKTVPPQRECSNRMPSTKPIQIKSRTSEVVTIESTGCSGQVMYVEHVVAIVSLSIPSGRGKLSIQLKSPMSTVSQLLYPRSKDNSKDGFVEWQFMSVHHWEERAVGEWVFTITNDHPSATATLSKIDLKLYGTLEDPKVFTRGLANISYSPSFAEFSHGVQHFSEGNREGTDSGSSLVVNRKLLGLVLVLIFIVLKTRVLQCS